MRKFYLIYPLLIFLVTLEPAACRGRGGGGRGGGGRGGSRGGGWGSRSSSGRSSSSWGSSSGKSSYPKQQWGTSASKGRFTNPKVTSYGSTFGSAGSYSYRSPGYGTRYGTSFPGGTGQFGGSGFGKKYVGLGTGAGFVGGSYLGARGTSAMIGVYHRYMMYRMLTGGLYHNHYYNNHYYNNQCYNGCPIHAHCEYGFCECDMGFHKYYGQCSVSPPSTVPSMPIKPDSHCVDTSQCQTADMNLICSNPNDLGGTCQCRQDMRWNSKANECQLYIDVDCSDVTYGSEPSPVVLKAVDETLQKIGNKNITENYLVDDKSRPVDSTFSPSPNASLENSLLSSINPNEASEHEMKEAFCRDVDSFSWDLAMPETEKESNWFLDHILEIALGIAACLVIFKILITYRDRRQIRRNGDLQHGNVAFSEVVTNQTQQPSQDTSLPYAVKPNQESKSNVDPPPYSASIEGPSAPTQPQDENSLPYPKADAENLPYPVHPPVPQGSDNRPFYQQFKQF